jgi:hypothetical protein
MATVDFVEQPVIKPEVPVIKKDNSDLKWKMAFRKARIYNIMISIVLLICINQLVGVFTHNPMNYLSDLIDRKSGYNIRLADIIYCIAGVIAIKLALTRDFHLPFLGNAVVPASLMPVHIPEKTNMSVPIKTKPNTKIIYWSALAENEKTKVQQAYGDFHNSGVVISDENGLANLPIQESTGYVVPNNKHIKRHVHYRLANETVGMLSPIETIYY